MTSKDDIKTDIQAVDDAKKTLADAEARLETDKLDLVADAAPPNTGSGDGDGAGQGAGPGDPAGDPPADDTPPANDPPANDPPVNDPPANDPPAVNVVRITVADKNPEHPGVGNTIVLVQNGSSADWWKTQPADPTTGEPVFVEAHASGKPIYLGGCIALYVGNAKTATQVWPADPVPLPDGTLPPQSTPTGPSSPTGPATTPPVAFPASPGLDTTTAIDPANMWVTLTFADGSKRDYNGALAVDCGDWTPEGFAYTQRTFELWDEASNYRIFFRPDSTSGRWETVHEFCNPALTAVPPAMPAHTVEVFASGKSLGKIDVPTHHFNTRWRFQSSWRATRTDIAALIAAKKLPPYARTAISQALPAPATPYLKPMDASNITLYEPTTGERLDIGLDNEYEAAFIATGDAGMVNSLMAWAEAAGSMPFHARDPKTGRYINWADYPKSSWYNAGTFDPIKLALGSTSPFTISANHHPSLSYTAFILTGDLYHLENLQAGCACFVASYPGFRDHFRSDEARVYAWVLRTAVDTIAATPDAPGTISLLPKAVFKALLDRDRDWFTANYVNNPSVKTAVFHSGVDVARAPLWEEDYLGIVLGWTVLRGFTDWAPISAWKAVNASARCDGKSGWPRTTPIIYYALPDDWTKTPPPSTWADLATLNSVTLTADGHLGAGLSASYLADLRGHLVLTGAGDPLTWLESEMERGGYTIPWRTSFLRAAQP